MLPGLQTTVGLRDWHSLNMKSVHLNAPSEGRGGSQGVGGGLAGSTSPLYPSGAGCEEKGLYFWLPQDSTRGQLDFTLVRTNWGRSQGEFPKLHCQRKLYDSLALPVPECGGGSDRPEPGFGLKQS